MIKISDRDKKVLIIGGIVVSVISFYIFIISPFKESHHKIREDIPARLNIISQYEALTEQMKKKGDSLNTYQTRFEELKTQLLTGDKPSLAAADLQKILQDLSTRLEIPVDSIRVSATKEGDSFIQVPVEITIKCKMRKLRELMYEVENNTKLLTISKLSVKSLDVKNPVDIEARVEVSGFIMKT